MRYKNPVRASTVSGLLSALRTESRGAATAWTHEGMLVVNNAPCNRPLVSKVHIKPSLTRLFVPVLLSLFSVPAFADMGQGQKPSVIIFLTDDQALNTMFMMDRTNRVLTSQGASFSNSFPDNNLCSPSRATLQTGQTSHNSGVITNEPPNGGYGVFAQRENNGLPVWLQANGYRTGWIGKYINGYPTKRGTTHVPPGWDEWDVFAKQQREERFFYDYVLNQNGTLVSYGSAPEDYSTDVIRDKSLAFIRDAVARNQPYVLIIALHAPHTPATAAPRHTGAFAGVELPKPLDFNEPDFSDKPLAIQTIPLLSAKQLNRLRKVWQKQLESLLAVDELVEGVVNVVEELGQASNTNFVYTTDNGYFMGSKRTEGKLLTYEDGIHIPLVIRGAGVQPGVVLPNLVNNADVVATILDWTHTTPGNVVDGRSLVGLLADSTTPWRSAVLMEARFEQLPNARYSAVRTASDIYIENTTEQFGIEEEYYDFGIDPYELNSVNEPTERKDYLRPLLNGLKTCAGESCFVP